jgi:hypothetical protein
MWGGYSRTWTDDEIISVGNIDSVINVSGSDRSQSVDVVVSDKSGMALSLVEGLNLQSCSATVTITSGAFTTSFTGKLNSPTGYNYSSKIFSFNITTNLEDAEVGFSVEEGDISNIPENLIGKPWPMIFGTVADCPALQINPLLDEPEDPENPAPIPVTPAIPWTTLTGVGIIEGITTYEEHDVFPDITPIQAIGQYLWESNERLNLLQCALSTFGSHQLWIDHDKYEAEYEALDLERRRTIAVADCEMQCAINERKKQIADATANGVGVNPLKTTCADMPQGVEMTLNISGGLFIGMFWGTDFYISSRSHPKLADNAIAIADSNTITPCDCIPSETTITFVNEVIAVPCGSYVNIITKDPITGADIPPVWDGGPTKDGCECTNEYYYITTPRTPSPRIIQPILQQFWAEAGTSIEHVVDPVPVDPGAVPVPVSDKPVAYIISIIPGSVEAVKAYKTINNIKTLCLVPADLYTVTSQVYDTVQAVQIDFANALSNIVDGGWSDDIYVTFESAVDGTPVEIMQYLINTYSDWSLDGSFTGGPSTRCNFAILDRKNLLELLREIAFQAKCALWVDNNVAYLKYLPTMSIVGTVDDSVISIEPGIERLCPPTEDIVTKAVVKWRSSLAPGITDQKKDASEKTIILRENIDKFGVLQVDWDFYIYNDYTTILEAATYWLHKKANPTNILKFKTFLDQLGLDVFDDITVQTSVYNGTAMITQSVCNPDENTIDFECVIHAT